MTENHWIAEQSDANDKSYGRRDIGRVPVRTFVIDDDGTPVRRSDLFVMTCFHHGYSPVGCWGQFPAHVYGDVVVVVLTCPLCEAEHDDRCTYTVSRAYRTVIARSAG